MIRWPPMQPRLCQFVHLTNKVVENYRKQVGELNPKQRFCRPHSQAIWEYPLNMEREGFEPPNLSERIYSPLQLTNFAISPVVTVHNKTVIGLCIDAIEYTINCYKLLNSYNSWNHQVIVISMPHEGLEPSSIDGVSIILLRTMRQGGVKRM